MMGGLSWLMTGTTAGLIPMMMLCHEHEEDRGCDPNLRLRLGALLPRLGGSIRVPVAPARSTSGAAAGRIGELSGMHWNSNESAPHALLHIASRTRGVNAMSSRFWGPGNGSSASKNCCTNCCTILSQNALKRPGTTLNRLYLTTTYAKLSLFVIDRSSVQVRSSAPFLLSFLPVPPLST